MRVFLPESHCVRCALRLCATQQAVSFPIRRSSLGFVPQGRDMRRNQRETGSRNMTFESDAQTMLKRNH